MMSAVQVVDSLRVKSAALRMEADLLERVADDIKAEAIAEGSRKLPPIGTPITLSETDRRMRVKVLDNLIAKSPIADAVNGSRRRISAKGRRAIAAAQRRRWAAKKAASEKMRKLALRGARLRKAEKRMEAGADGN